jgi:hypothetical protein
MKTLRLAMVATLLVIAQGYVCPVEAQEDDEAGAITARVHGTFQDRTGGLGVLSGDMMIGGFEVRNGTLTAIGKIVGSLADASGNVLGQVNHELALPVANVTSTCNQLRMELAATDAEVLKTPVHFDAEVAGFDSRDGAIPKALAVLCSAGELLRGKPTPSSLAAALNRIVATIRPPKDR